MQERLTIAAARLHLWAAFRITYPAIVSIVAAMATDDTMDFGEALAAWAGSWSEADGSGWSAARWRSEICYRLLKAGQEAPGGLAAWFEARAKEVRQLANEQK